MVQGAGCRVQGAGCRVEGRGSRGEGGGGADDDYGDEFRAHTHGFPHLKPETTIPTVFLTSNTKPEIRNSNP